MEEAEGSCSLSKELFVCLSLVGVTPLHHRNILFAPGVGISGGWQGANPHLQPALSKGHCPSWYHLSEEFLVQYSLGLCN